jgi:putative glutamine amidotransferase
MSLGALPFMVPAPSGDTFRGDVAVADYARALDGIVMHGGADVWPGSYGEEPLRPEWTGDRVRDEYEMALVRAFSAAGKPVFGICRGLQLINVAHGGTLYQDIATQKPGSRTHRDADTYDLNFHDVNILPGTRLADLLGGPGNHTINSVHHQGIKDLAPGFKIEATSPDDGVIEAIRATGDAPGSTRCSGTPNSTAPGWAWWTTPPAARLSGRRHSGTPYDVNTMTTLAIHNPATGDKIATFPQTRHKASATKAAAARAAQPAWAATPLATRKACIEKFRAGVVRDLASLAATMTRETGKPIKMSRNELNGLLGRIDFFLEEIELSVATETVYDEGGMTEQIQHTPLGVVANISAWNYPWFVGCNVIVPALLTGNAVLYKPSEYAALTGLEIARLLHEAGVPRDVMVCLVGAGELGTALWRSRSTACSSPAVPRASASRRRGRKVHQAAAGTGRQGPDLCG